MKKELTLKGICNRVIEFNLLKLIKPFVVFFIALLILYGGSLGYAQYTEIRGENDDRKLLLKSQILWDETFLCINNIEEEIYDIKIREYVDCTAGFSSLKEALLGVYLYNEILGSQFIRATKNNYSKGKRPISCLDGSCY